MRQEKASKNGEGSKKISINKMNLLQGYTNSGGMFTRLSLVVSKLTSFYALFLISKETEGFYPTQKERILIVDKLGLFLTLAASEPLYQPSHSLLP